jgi:hypothetical protein
MMGLSLSATLFSLVEHVLIILILIAISLFNSHVIFISDICKWIFIYSINRLLYFFLEPSFVGSHDIIFYKVHMNYEQAFNQDTRYICVRS